MLMLGLGVAGPALATFLVAKIVTLLQESRANLGEQRFDLLTIIARKVVAAAEQAGIGDLVEREGTAKKEWAVEAAKALLAQAGMKNVDVDAISAAIEAEVFAFKRKLYAEVDKGLAPPPAG